MLRPVIREMKTVANSREAFYERFLHFVEGLVVKYKEGVHIKFSFGDFNEPNVGQQLIWLAPNVNKCISYH